MISIGRQPSDPRLVGLLLACHGRIRNFTTMAVTVGTRDDLTGPDVMSACASVERYFRLALPLHVQDEDESLWPRLTGHTWQLDAALAELELEHASHAPLVLDLLSACARVRRNPMAAAFRNELRIAADRLALAFGPHLEREEDLVFPAIEKLLDPATQEQVVQEMRARR